MKHLLTAASAMCVLFASNVQSEITELNHYFKLFCVSEKSTGLDWKKNAWIYSKYKGQKYLIRKVKIEPLKILRKGELFPKSGACATTMSEKINPIVEFADYKYDYGCYNIGKFGKEYSNIKSRLCSQQWKKQGTQLTLTRVNCQQGQEDFIFAPNGWFHHSLIHSNLADAPKNDFKGSLFVEVGKCSEIE